MYIVTGAAGMIGSAFVWKLNEAGIHDIILVDQLECGDKWLNIRKRKYTHWVDKNDLFDWLEALPNPKDIEGVIHMGACSATTETDGDYLMSNNYGYTKKLWEFCATYDIPYIYASSAATYGAGEQGYNDNVTPDEMSNLMPLNKYGYSKKIFDDWAQKQSKSPTNWYGVKFFNVYGPQEYHKGRMASMVFHSYHQLQDGGKIKLFKSHKEGYADGGQLRDFVYVKDVVDVMYYFLTAKPTSGIYNIGTGKARSFHDLALATARNTRHNPALTTADAIEYIPMPEDLRGKYQYFTEAKMGKLRNTGYTGKFHTLEEGVADYVNNYLAKEDSYL